MGKASDNPYPSMLYVEGTTPSSPASGKQRLFVRSSDHVLCMVNSSGTVTPLSGALSNPMTTKGDIIIADTSGTPTRLAASTSGYVLTAQGAGAFPAWAAAAGGYLGTRTEAVLGADVTMTTATTEYDGPTNTPAAGVYDVLAYLMCKSGVTNVITNFVGRLKYGSTVVDERQAVEYVGNDFGYPTIIPLSARVTADGSTAIKISATADRNSAAIMRDPFSNSSGVHRATLLVLVRVS